MRPLSDILSEKEWVTSNLKKAGIWCAAGVAITFLSLLLSSHLGFSVITLGAIGWGGWNVYKCLKRLDELKKEEEHYKSERTSTSKSSSSCHSSTGSSTIGKSSLRSKTFK